MTGHGDISMTVRAMKAGAVEFLPKPFRDQDILDAVQAGLERDRTRRRSASDSSKLKASFDPLTATRTGNYGLRYIGPDEQADCR